MRYFWMIYIFKFEEKLSTYSQARAHVCAVLDWPERGGQGLYTVSQNDQGGFFSQNSQFSQMNTGCRAFMLDTLF